MEWKFHSPCKQDPRYAFTSKGVRLGEKVVVTENNIYDWITQLYDVRIDNFPKTKP